jgi:hypothetical protein
MALYQLGRALDVAEMWLAGYDIPMERPAEQKENDELADLVERIKKEKEFKEVIFQINHLNSSQLHLFKTLLAEIQIPPQEHS